MINFCAIIYPLIYQYSTVKWFLLSHSIYIFCLFTPFLSFFFQLQSLIIILLFVVIIIPLQLILQLGIVINLLLTKIRLLKTYGHLPHPILHMKHQMFQPTIDSIIDHFNKILFPLLPLCILTYHLYRF